MLRWTPTSHAKRKGLAENTQCEVSGKNLNLRGPEMMTLRLVSSRNKIRSEKSDFAAVLDTQKAHSLRVAETLGQGNILYYRVLQRGL